MKRCAQCHGKLGLGTRFRNLWNGWWWAHLRFCSAHCERFYQLERLPRGDLRGKGFVESLRHGKNPPRLRGGECP